MKKHIVSATLDQQLLKKLNRLSEETERNRSWLISEALEVYFEELEDLQIAKGRLLDKHLTPSSLRREIGLSD